MWELYEDMWEEQIGFKNVGHDFSGREIHKEDFGNPTSKFGWTLLPFGDNQTFLVVHNETMAEFPKFVEGEFIVNGKVFEIVDSPENDGTVDINEVVYETTETETKIIQTKDNNAQYNEEIEKIEKDMRLSKKHIEKELKQLKKQILSQQTEIDQQTELNEIQELKEKLKFLEEEYQKDINEIRNQYQNIDLNDKNSNAQQIELLKTFSQKFQQQEEEIQELKKQHQEELNALRNQLLTQQIEIKSKDELTEVEILKEKLKFLEEEYQKLENDYQKDINEIRNQNIDLSDKNNELQIELFKSLSQKFQQQEEELQNLKQQVLVQQSGSIHKNEMKEFEALKEKLGFLEEEYQRLESDYQRDVNDIKSQYESINNNDKNDVQQIDILKKFQQQEEELNALRKHQFDQERKIIDQEKHIIELEKTASLNLENFSNSLSQKLEQVLEKKEKKDEIKAEEESSKLNQQPLQIVPTPVVIIEEKVKTEDLPTKEEIQVKEDTEKKSSKQEHFIEWEKHFGDKIVAFDYAKQLMIKDEFGKNVEGGWGFDNFPSSNNESNQFISSLKSISQRAGKNPFIVEGNQYQFVEKNGQWLIELIQPKNEQEIREKEIKKAKYTLYSKDVIQDDIRKFAPTTVKKYNGEYESYSSLLINLNHFPIDYLDNFDKFLTSMVSDLPVFKEKFIYLNRRAYESGNSNVTSYARVFFKYNSTKEEIEILFAALALKNALIDFINTYRSKNNRYVVSFSMVLSNHKREFKFIQSQTNFDILNKNPVPFKIPLYKLILDSEFNALLKYHENELWKKVVPFALDHQGNTYYMLDVNPDEYYELTSNYLN